MPPRNAPYNRKRIGGLGVTSADEARLKAIIAQQFSNPGRYTDWRLTGADATPTGEQLRKGFTKRAEGLGIPKKYAPYAGEVAAFGAELHPAVSISEAMLDLSEDPEDVWAATQATVGVVPGLGKAVDLMEKLDKASRPTPIDPALKKKSSQTPGTDIPEASKIDPTNPTPAAGLGAPSSVKASAGTVVPASSVVDPTLAPAKGIGTNQAKTTAKAARVKARGLGAQGKGTIGTVAPEPLASGRISQRYPTGVDTEDPLTQNLLINTNVLKGEPDKLAQAAEIIRSYPGVTKKMLEMDPAQLVDAFRDSISGNLTALYDLMPPAEAQRAARWYHGAHRISQERAQEVGIHPYASAGMYAALSPQMDWYKNVYLGDQVARILNRDPKMDREMLRRAGEQKSLKTAYGDNPERMEILRSLEGRSLGAMTPEEQALVLRLYDETYGSRQYNRITPEGDYSGLVLTGKGEPAKPGWGSFSDIEKSILAARSGGDPSLISPLMGFKHKVRNFYNDIVAPLEAEKFGDVTIDTHQIAGGLLRPLAGEDIEVATGLGSKPPSSAATGLQGLYPIYADATRNAAAARNVPVIAMQSVPWEAIRSLFPKEFKTAASKAKIEKIWRDYGAGKISAPEARRRVVAAAGGFRPPSW